MRAPLLSLCVACAPPPAPEPGVLTVVQEQQGSWVRNFNPLQVTGARWPARAGVYEPLVVFNGATGEAVPWLATDWAWEEGATALRFHLRPGVRWSDGQPFGADDVVFTFTLLREHPALDTGGAWRFLAGVEALDPGTVRFTLSRPFSPGLGQLASQPIVPAHAWAGVDDPVLFANPDPVGTGPFTEVRLFGPRVFELGANPHYWQQTGGVAALRFPALQSNEQVTLALLEGEVDWAGAFVPAVERIYVGRDPEHHHYWFPRLGNTVFLYAHATAGPTADPAVRRALSLALDRARIVQIALYDYTVPADPTGLSDGYARWRDPQAAAAGDWVGLDPARAAALLDGAGMRRGPDGWRTLPDGGPWRPEILVVSGWSDWVRAAQVLSRDLQAVGVDARVQALDFGAWFDRLTRGDFALSLGWSQEGPTPYEFYRGLMSARTVEPVGTAAATNWHRFGSPAFDALADAFERTTDPAEQRRIVAAMQQLFVEEVPAIPLFPSPSWGECNTTRFVGFPSARDPYARLSPNTGAEPLLVMTRVRPRAAALAVAP